MVQMDYGAVLPPSQMVFFGFAFDSVFASVIVKLNQYIWKYWGSNAVKVTQASIADKWKGVCLDQVQNMGGKNMFF